MFEKIFQNAWGRHLPFRNILNLACPTPLQDKRVTCMNRQMVKWCVDLAMGITFLSSAVTGFFKFTLLMRTLGLSDIKLPMALMSDLHDLSGILLCCLVAVHLFLNRAWILVMTKKILAGAPET